MLPHWMLILSVLSFFALIVYIGQVTSKWIASSSDFFVRGREVSLLINACAIGGIGFAASFVIAVILEPMTGYPYVVNVISITAGFLLYTFLGGMWAVTIVDVAHIVIGLPVYYIVCAKLLVKTDFLANLPDAGWRLYSIAGRLPIFDLTFPSAITFVLTWLLFVFGSQYYWIRLASARSERGAIGGAVWGGAGGMILLLAPMGLIGLFALTLVPGTWTPN
jgi:SSS family solute:Na+ symporter